MNNFLSAYFIILLIYISIIRRKEIQHIAKMKIIKRGDRKMQELAKRFIGMDVYIKMVGSEVEDGILKEVVDNAAVLEKDGKTRIINLDYVIRLMEYPKNKNGKRQGIVLD